MISYIFQMTGDLGSDRDIYTLVSSIRLKNVDHGMVRLYFKYLKSQL